MKLLTIGKVAEQAGVTVVAVVFMLFPNYVGFILARRESDEVITSSNPLIKTTFVAIEGMHCEGCAAIAEKSIMDVPGVLAVKVDYTGKYAWRLACKADPLWRGNGTHLGLG